MGWYHAMMTENDAAGIPNIVYHLCPRADYDAQSKCIYYPAQYDVDKFTRASQRLDQLMNIANCFYQKSSPANEAWVCLQVDTTGLKVLGIEVSMVDSEMDKTLQCPHIYGGIPQEAIQKVYPVIRASDDDGMFLFVEGLTDTCSSSNK